MSEYIPAIRGHSGVVKVHGPNGPWGSPCNSIAFSSISELASSSLSDPQSSGCPMSPMKLVVSLFGTGWFEKQSAVRPVVDCSAALLARRRLIRNRLMMIGCMLYRMIGD